MEEPLVHNMGELIKLGVEGLFKASQFSKYLKEAKSSTQTYLGNVCFKGVSLQDVETGVQTIDQKLRAYAQSVKER